MPFPYSMPLTESLPRMGMTSIPSSAGGVEACTKGLKTGTSFHPSGQL